MRIVTTVIQQVQVRAGGVYDLGCHIVLCPKCHRPATTGRYEELTGARTSGHGWRMVALGIMPGHGHPFVKAHLSGAPSQIASPFKGLTSRRLRPGCLHLQGRLSLGGRGHIVRRRPVRCPRGPCAGVSARKSSGYGGRNGRSETRI